MEDSDPSVRKGKNRNFVSTHEQIIKAAVQLISQSGVEALSVASLARETGLNRTTLYYHFKGREALLDAVHEWAAKELASAFVPTRSQEERIDYITRFVLENPQLMKLWIEDFISPGDIRHSYPYWDRLVEGIRDSLGPADETGVDAEVYCTMLLTSAMIAPRVFKNSVAPDADTETIVSRFRAERKRSLRHEALFHD